MTAPKELVTGPRKLVGEVLVFRLLVDKKFTVIAVARGITRLTACAGWSFSNGLIPVPCPLEFCASSHPRSHCCSSVVMNETVVDARTELCKVSVEGSVRLAQYSAESGAKHFIVIKSIKVNGENTLKDRLFRADDQPSPYDLYGVSKCEVEEALKQLGYDTGIKVVVRRPLLVCSPSLKANLLSMPSWLDKGVRLPLSSMRNQRRVVAIGNLVSFIVAPFAHPATANQTFLAGDGEDLRPLSKVLGKPARLLPLPEWLLKRASCAVA